MTRILTIVSLAFALTACGGAPSALDACKKSCDKQGECTNAGSAAVNTCKQGCDAKKAQLQDLDQMVDDQCKNAGTYHHEVYDCEASYCDPALAESCVNALFCEAK